MYLAENNDKKNNDGEIVDCGLKVAYSSSMRGNKGSDFLEQYHVRKAAQS